VKEGLQQIVASGRRHVVSAVAGHGTSSYLGSAMTFLLRRAFQGLIVVFLTTTIAFFLIHAAPGEPFAHLLTDPRATEEMRAAERERYGLDRPLPAQYVTFLSNVARGDLGESFTHRRPVTEVVALHAPRTLVLMGTALVLGFAGGILLGSLQGARPGSWFDRVTGGVAVLIAGLPDFWLALLALMLFASTWHLLPGSGIADPALPANASFGRRFVDLVQHFILPAGTLTVLIAATVSRYQRASLIEVMPETFLRAARAKGATRLAVVFRHALRNALLPIITLAGLAIPALLGGAVFVEVVFAWPGMGSLTVNAVRDRDYPLVLAVVLFSAVLVVLAAIIADVVQAAADPRRRHA
jgi:peptide/nickel transport system permease protein